MRKHVAVTNCFHLVNNVLIKEQECILQVMDLWQKDFPTAFCYLFLAASSWVTPLCFPLVARCRLRKKSIIQWLRITCFALRLAELGFHVH